MAGAGPAPGTGGPIDAAGVGTATGTARRPALAARLAIGFLLAYKEVASPRFGRHCRYQPTCSVYMLLAIERYGFWRGWWKGTRRLLSCGPWSKRPAVDWP